MTLWRLIFVVSTKRHTTTLFFLKLYSYIYLLSVHMDATVCVPEVRGQRAGFGSFLPPYGFQD